MIKQNAHSHCSFPSSPYNLNFSFHARSHNHPSLLPFRLVISSTDLRILFIQLLSSTATDFTSFHLPSFICHRNLTDTPSPIPRKKNHTELPCPFPLALPSHNHLTFIHLRYLATKMFFNQSPFFPLITEILANHSPFFFLSFPDPSLPLDVHAQPKETRVPSQLDHPFTETPHSSISPSSCSLKFQSVLFLLPFIPDPPFPVCHHSLIFGFYLFFLIIYLFHQDRGPHDRFSLNFSCPP